MMELWERDGEGGHPIGAAGLGRSHVPVSPIPKPKGTTGSLCPPHIPRGTPHRDEVGTGFKAHPMHGTPLRFHPHRTHSTTTHPSPCTQRPPSPRYIPP